MSPKSEKEVEIHPKKENRSENEPEIKYIEKIVIKEVVREVPKDRPKIKTAEVGIQKTVKTHDQSV